MKKLLALLLLASTSFAADSVAGNAKRLGNKPLCAGPITTNCVTSADASGNVSIGTTVHSSETEEPTCNEANRGKVVRVLGGAGVADTYRQCAKTALDTYAWSSLSSTGGALPAGCSDSGSNGITCTGAITASAFQSPEGTAFAATGAEQAKPTAPAAGSGNMWFDSTAHMPQYQGSAGTVLGTMVQPVTTADRVVTAIGADGVPAVATLPSCSNATTSKLLYDTTTHTFSCGEDQSTAGTGGKAILRLQYYGSATAPDATKHWYAGLSGTSLSPSSGSANFQVPIPITGTIVAASVTLHNSAASTSPGGDSAIRLCINGTSINNAACNGTSIDLAVGFNMPNGTTYRPTNPIVLSQAVTAGTDKINIDVVPGTYTTNANIYIWIDLVIQ